MMGVSKSQEMGVSQLLQKVVDITLFGFFLVIAIAAPTIGSQMCLSESLFPSALLELKSWYAREFGDYLAVEGPHFYVGLVWLELLFQWPLSLLNLYAIVASKPWLNTTCLIYGASILPAMVAILSEMIGSGRASDRLLYMHYPFLGFAILAMLRGLLPHSGKKSDSSSAAGKGGTVSRKKRA